ncbi:N-acyl-D-amino-acid deacylase family protein [Agromyces cerinus]|uniref:N-acyl-D-amino-acid deacylase n=1 Tax=Agromyces cerinus subsp. cerinus TaxID=232089 RepID=A0A1N6DDW1_9MICO|nr:amidohydrolase family protein [Agromyces cerinus]SIN69010.1 N-acyl-D-amino-acid deacylase [Agromyces cerinus subsp. cerinus]
MSILIRNAIVVDAAGAGAGASDVVVDGERIARIGPATSDDARDAAHAHVIDGRGRLLMPGFVDAHSHADGALFDPDVQLALLRQGVTTVIGGQDGVSYAPGDGAYATEYFAAINGGHPSYRGGGIAALLAAYDGTTAVNAGVLVPAGTVRFVVSGRSTDAASPDELDRMRVLVADGLADGALGLSTGLDYVPGIFADTAELAALAGPVADAGAVYVSHMRGGYEANSAAGIAEMAAIARETGARIHVSHFHAEPHLVRELLAELERDGVDATFDAYPYTRGCSILAMPILPASLTVRPGSEVVAELADPAARARLRREWFPTITRSAGLGPEWPSMLTLAHVAAPDYDWAHGLTIAQGAAEASGRSGTSIDAIDFALDVLVASRLEVNVVMAVQRERSDAGLAEILSHRAAIGGSDGIFIGRHPHPRARGSFSRYLAMLVREQAALGWADAAALVSSRAAARFGLGDRGAVREGFVADLVLVDPDAVRATASYVEPLGLAVGIDDVLVAGVPVLAGGALTGATPGRGIRRGGITTDVAAVDTAALEEA